VTDEQWRQIEPHLPQDVRGKARVDGRHAPRDLRTFSRRVRDDAINSYGMVLPIKDTPS
jgi:hypothetical protein